MGLTGGQQWAHCGVTALPGLTQPWPLGVEVSLSMGSPIRDNIQSDNLPHLGGEHRVPPETQEERDLGLKTLLSSVTSALGDTFLRTNQEL